MSYKIWNINPDWAVNTETGAMVLRSANPEYLAWLAEGNTPEPADPTPNPRIAELKSELAALDIKRIRPTAEGDTVYLAILNAQAIALRAELKAL